MKSLMITKNSKLVTIFYTVNANGLDLAFNSLLNLQSFRLKKRESTIAALTFKREQEILTDCAPNYMAHELDSRPASGSQCSYILRQF